LSNKKVIEILDGKGNPPREKRGHVHHMYGMSKPYYWIRRNMIIEDQVILGFGLP
jgi:hypothetical protein